MLCLEWKVVGGSPCSCLMYTRALVREGSDIVSVSTRCSLGFINTLMYAMYQTPQARVITIITLNNIVERMGGLPTLQ